MLTQVVAGRLNKQIAADLGTVVKTVKVHRARVMQKMGVRSLAQLVRVATAVGVASALQDQVATPPRRRNLAGIRRDQNERPIVSDTPRSLFSRPAGGSLL